MIGRKYIVVTVLAWLSIISLVFVLAFDSTRMEIAEAQHMETMIARGAELYAENCMQCHGAAGQGFVGAPLNTEDLQGDPRTDQDKYFEIYSAIAHGRPGTTVPKWLALPNGHWASYTQMPAWHVDNDGPLNEMHIRALTYFIMSGEWNRVRTPLPVYATDDDGNESTEATIAALPVGQDIDEATSLRARQIFVQLCFGCHAIGGYGNTIGPDLSNVGSWAVGITREGWGDFLRHWIRNPIAVWQRGNRAPVYWSNYAGPLLEPTPVDMLLPEGTDLNGFDPTVFAALAEEGIAVPDQMPQAGVRGVAWGIEIPDPTPLPATQMPPFSEVVLSDEDLDILVEYLLSLR